MDDFYLKCPYCESGMGTDSDSITHLCDQCGQETDIKKLVVTGDDLKTADGRMISALRVAVRHGWHNEIVLLAGSGYDLDRKDEDGKTSLKFVIDHIGLDNQEIFVNTSLLLIENGADVNVPDSQPEYPIHASVRCACLPVVISLIEHGADMNVTGVEEMSVLHYCGEPPEFLVEKFQNEQLELSNKAFWEHFDDKQKEIAELLLSSGADLHRKQSLAWTPLSRIAALGGNPAMVKLFIDHGADRNHRSETGFTPLGYARLKENISPRHALIAKMLSDLGAVDARPGLCFIATAVYGSHDSSSVIILRNYRDQKLANQFFGTMVIKFYYWIGPKAAEYVHRRPKVKSICRAFLDIMVRMVSKNPQ